MNMNKMNFIKHSIKHLTLQKLQKKINMNCTKTKIFSLKIILNMILKKKKRYQLHSMIPKQTLKDRNHKWKNNQDVKIGKCGNL